MHITVQLKEQYGQVVAHPICAAAKTFAAIASTKTLTPAAVSHIMALGYEIRRHEPLGTTSAKSTGSALVGRAA